MLKYYLIIGALSVLAIFLVGMGIVDSGGPMAAAGQKNDQKRSSDFNSLSYSVDDYVMGNGRLPSSLQELSTVKSNLKITDPDSGKTYEYKVISKTTYELCAVFYSDQKKLNDYYADGYSDEAKAYKKGYSCLTYVVDPYSFDEHDLKVDREPVVSDFPEEPESSRSGNLNN